MFWAVRHEWPSGVQFMFNCYRHWSTLVVQEKGDRSGHLLHSKKGVTQGDPLAMIAYGISILPPHQGASGRPPQGHSSMVR